MPFKEPPKQPNFPELEEDILKFWDREKIFEKSLEQTKDKPHFVMFEGPPTANGKPHIGHFITRVFKDIVPRYKTMRGYYVLRKGGWDTHGLPVELEVEKELGIGSKQEIENLVPGDPVKSIAKFNELCKRSVWKYVDLWEKMIRRVGNWFDLKNAYVSYHNDYIESVWWAFKEYWKRELLYRGYKVVPYCTRCGTPLSSHEVAQGYETVKENSVYVRFPLVGEKDTSLLAWTTTPWTLPGNIALAVDPKAEYVKVREREGLPAGPARGQGEKEGASYVIVAKARAEALKLTDIIETMKGTALVGKRYQPLFPWLRALIGTSTSLSVNPEHGRRIDRTSPQFEVVEADFVSMEEGTGIVHTAVMYGEEDFALGQKLGLPQRHLVDRNGRFVAETGWLAGKYVKDADPLISHDLRSRGLIFKEEMISHEYPFCWRCHRPLLYYALESWFIKTTAVKNDLIKHNKAVNWIPEAVGRGRMANWYETLIDWAISRNRYWGTPLPAWICDKNPDHIEIIGSYDELKQRIGRPLPKDFDPHRPYIDAYTWNCSRKDGGVMRRVPEVTDVWHDAGSMPFAQWHYPFENKEMVDKGKQFPADYISEATDQTRGWFYNLQAISTILFEKNPYKNVVVFAHALDAQGRKMSKHLGNVLDPWEAIDQLGADPIRWFFLTSVTIGTAYRVSIEVLKETMRRFFLILWNSYSFFVTYANLDGWNPGKGGKALPEGDLLDRWITARTNELVAEVTGRLDAYDFPAAGRGIQDFVVNDLSGWYIRRSRGRVGPRVTDEGDKAAFYSTVYQVFKTLALLLAPFTPFTAEYLYRSLRRANEPPSVHLLDWPESGRVDRRIIEQMGEVRQVVEEGLRQRKEHNLKVRQPLSGMKISGVGEWPEPLREIVGSELNVKVVEVRPGQKLSVSLETKLTDELLEEGKVRDLIRIVQDLRKKAGYRFDEEAQLSVTSDSSLWKGILERHGESIENETKTQLATVTAPDAQVESEGLVVAVSKSRLPRS